MFDSFNINNMSYNLYDEYLKLYQRNALNYSKLNGLSIKYYHINLEKSKNYDYETGMNISMKNTKFDVYEFIPIIQMNPPASMATFDQSEQGDSYISTVTLTIIGVKNPLPGDLFHFYDITGKGYIDIEIYRVKRITYNKSMNEKLSMYQIDGEYAPLKYNSLQEILKNNTIKHYLFNSNLNNFIPIEKKKYIDFLKNNLDKIIIDSEDFYNTDLAKFNLKKLNSIMKFLSMNYRTKTKIIDDKYNSEYVKEFLSKMDRFKVNCYNKDEDNCKLPDEKIETIKNEEDTENAENNEFVFSDIKSDNEIEIFSRKLDDSNSDDNKYICNTNKNLFNFYFNLYKVICCYREIDKNFYNNLYKESSTQNNDLVNNDIFFNNDGVVDRYYFEKKNKINYDSGGYLSYNSGQVLF